MGPYSFFNSFLSLSADLNEAYSREKYSSRQPIYTPQHRVHHCIPVWEIANTGIAARNDYNPVWDNAQ